MIARNIPLDLKRSVDPPASENQGQIIDWVPHQASPAEVGVVPSTAGVPNPKNHRVVVLGPGLVRPRKFSF